MGCSAFGIGFRGEFDAKMSSLNSLQWGVHKDCKGIEFSFVNSDYRKPLLGDISIYKTLESGPFCCVGVQANTGDHKLAVSAATECCNETTKYLLEQDGCLRISKKKNLNKSLTLSVAAALNLTNLNSGHKFGLGLQFN